MPARNRRGKRRRTPFNDWQKQHLLTGEIPDFVGLGVDVFERFGPIFSAPHERGTTLADFWVERRDEILPAFVRAHPGHRPFAWWAVDAPRSPLGTYPGCWYDGKLPEPRARLSGTGKPLCEFLAYVPRFQFGVPVDWMVPGDPYCGLFDGQYDEHIADPDDPPLYEGEADYLKRHNLLLPGERPPRSAFVPESIDVDAIIAGGERPYIPRYRTHLLIQRIRD